MAEIGIIGLGALGAAMAARLLAKGHTVVGYNRTAEKAHALRDSGLQVARDAKEAASAAIVFSVLLNDAAVHELLLDGFPFSNDETTHVSVSTIGIPVVRALQARHDEAGHRFVSAPVFGRPQQALEGALVVACGGTDDAVAHCRPVLEDLGQVAQVGTAPEAANVAKMAGNFLMASAVQSLREAMALVDAAGIDRGQFADIVSTALFPTSFYRRFGALIAEQGSNAAAVNPFANSARLSGETAADLGLAAPLTATLADALRARIA